MLTLYQSPCLKDSLTRNIQKWTDATPNALSPSLSTPASLLIVPFVLLLRAPSLLGSPSILPEALCIQRPHNCSFLSFCSSHRCFSHPSPLTGFSGGVLAQFSHSPTLYVPSQDKPFNPGGVYKGQNTGIYAKSSQIKQEKKRFPSSSLVIISMHGWKTIYAIFLLK